MHILEDMIIRINKKVYGNFKKSDLYGRIFINLMHFFLIKVIRNSIYLVSSFLVCVKANKIKTFILLA